MNKNKKVIKPIIKNFVLAGLLLTGLASCSTNTTPEVEKTNYQDLTVIAHRGGSGYLPEHTLATKAYAIAIGADYVEQDVVLTKDDVAIVVHDAVLERLTDVAIKFPHIKRADGHYYTVDLTYDEIKTLDFFEGVNEDGSQEYPERFPTGKSHFKIHSLADEIEFIQGLEKTTGRSIGLYVEVKHPPFFKNEGKDISMIVLNILKEYGYTSKSDKIYFQTFDFNELKRVHDELLPKLGMDLKLVQLIAYTDWNEIVNIDKSGNKVSYSYDWMFKVGAMAEIAKYADGIGPWVPMLVKDGDTQFKDNITNSTLDKLQPTGMIKEAHDNNLIIHPYTFRKDKGLVPSYAIDFSDYITKLADLGVDGFFTDQPEDVLEILGKIKVRTRL